MHGVEKWISFPRRSLRKIFLEEEGANIGLDVAALPLQPSPIAKALNQFFYIFLHIRRIIDKSKLSHIMTYYR